MDYDVSFSKGQQSFTVSLASKTFDVLDFFPQLSKLSLNLGQLLGRLVGLLL